MRSKSQDFSRKFKRFVTSIVGNVTIDAVQCKKFKSKHLKGNLRNHIPNVGLNKKFFIVEEAPLTLIHNSPSISALAASSALSIKFLALLVICGNLAYQFLTTFCSINNKTPSDLTKTQPSPSPPPPHPLTHFITTPYHSLNFHATNACQALPYIAPPMHVLCFQVLWASQLF